MSCVGSSASDTEIGSRTQSICTATGKQDIESAVIDDNNTIASDTAAGARELSSCTATGKMDIKSAVKDGINTFASGNAAGVRELSTYTATWKQDIKSAVKGCNNSIASGIETGVRELSICTANGKNDIESAVIDGNNTIASDIEARVRELSICTATGKQGIESAVKDGNNTFASGIEEGVRELSICTSTGEQDIESAVIDGNNTLASVVTAARVRKLSTCTATGKQDIQSAVKDGNNTITSGTVARVRELSICTATGKQEIESAVIDGNNTIASGTVACVRELSISTATGKQGIESAVIDGNNTIASGIEAGVRELSICTATGKQEIESAVIDGNNTLASGTAACVRELSTCTATWKQDIESAVKDGNNTIASGTAARVRELSICTATGKQDIESAVIEGNNNIASGTAAGVRELSICTATGKQDIESAVIDGNNTIASSTADGEREMTKCTATGKQAIESAVIDGNNTIASGIEAGVRELSICTATSKQDIESAVIECNESIASAIDAGGRELTAHTTRGRQVIQSDIEAGREELLAQVEDAKRDIGDFKAKKDDEDYNSQCKGMLGAMLNHYNTRLSHVTTSPLNDWVQAKLDNIYMPPNLQFMVKFLGSFKKNGTQITAYKDLFLRDSKLNKHIFIQGEAGCGKSAFIAKLVMDWCSLNTTQAFRPSQMEETNTTDSDSQIRRTHFFEDSVILNGYKFVFLITLRDLVKQIDILEMIKQQIIDSLYGKEGRETAYKLLNKIMERERCLVLLDGLDEWTDHVGHYLPALAASHNQCDVLITTRPWKLTQSNIPESKIDTLMHLEGVFAPFEVSRRLLACGDDSKTSKDFDNMQSEFESYIFKNGLYEQLVSPMLLSLIVQLWIEKTEIKGSKCEIYTLLMDSLLKKANSETGEFQELPFRCFTSTKYIKPNIEHIDRLAEAAFYLLFVDKRENSLVFSNTELRKYKLVEQERDFALKSGILSATRNVSKLISSSSFSFIHKSMQEFLAAYHIARNIHMVDDVISVYLTDHKNAYLDISQVFIFLCGLDVSAGNALSDMMNECDVASGLHPKYETAFQKTIVSGYREAVANGHSDIRLQLSHFNINEGNIEDCHSIWKHNKTSAISLDIEREEVIGEQFGVPAFSFEFDLSSCHKLRSLALTGEWIGFKDSASSATLDLPVWIVLNSKGSSPVLPSIEKIELRSLKWSYTWLRSLFCILLTLRHKLECVLEQCKIASCVQGAVGGLYTYTYATIITGLNHTFKLVDYRVSGLGLWKALYGLNIKYLSLNIRSEDLNNAKHDSPLLQSLLSLKQLEQLSIDVDYESPELLEILFSLNIKCVTLSHNGHSSGLVLSHVSVRVNDLLVSKQMEHIYIDVNANPNLFKRLYGLKIKSLTLCGNGERLEANHVPLMLKALSSLKKLEELSIISQNDSPGLWQALFGLKIKLLKIGTEQRGLEVKHVSSLLTSLSSLKQLDTFIIILKNSIPGLFEALQNLKIKNLSWEEGHFQIRAFPQNLSLEFEYNCSGFVKAPYILHAKSLFLDLWRRFEDLNLNQKSSLLQFLSAPKKLETLKIHAPESPGLWEALHGLNIKNLSLSLKYGPVYGTLSISQALSSLTRLETLYMMVDDDKDHCLHVGHLEAIRSLNITSLSLETLTLSINEIASLSQSLSSLTHLESLSIKVTRDSPFPELSDALRDLNIKSLNLTKSLTYFNLNCDAFIPSK